MEMFMAFPRLIPGLFTLALIVLIIPVHGQISTSCTPSMLITFAPCMNFITNSTSNATSPSSNCCNSLRSLAGNGTQCLCLIVTGNAPFQMPINQTLAISLPRACNMPSVPLQCKATVAPSPPPGPITLGPTTSPTAPSASPQASTVPEQLSPAPATVTTPAPPQASTVPEQLSPAPATVTTPAPPQASTVPQPLSPAPATVTTPVLTPTTNSGIRPVVNSSAANPSHSVAPSILLAVFGAIAALKYY
ncbi:unnamed protein product [Ilex paraguariensis]|uniref:Bifunctional inhibitor/plant lipid transfer protein/seed storage helical domain-containing protein n=1 Tax=Ilex paraguariensis TaxID=185542 RepID=A0ABC8SH32_9AQUA